MSDGVTERSQLAGRGSGSDSSEAFLLDDGAGSPGCCPPSVACCKGTIRFMKACCGEVWCGVGPEICKLLCAPPLPSRIASKLAFAPPRTSYDVVLDPATGTHQLLLRADSRGNFRPFTASWQSMSENFGMSAPASGVAPVPFTLDVDWLKTRSKQYVAGLYIRPWNFNANTFTLLFSHGNGTDIGEMLEFFVVLARDLGVATYAYEYTGYGAASGTLPHESQVLLDATAAWDKLTGPRAADCYGVPRERVILYGQSIGSGPSTYLASQPFAASAAALILHSPILSGIRVMLPIERTLFVDPFPNIDWITKVAIPVAVIHGTADEIVPFAHGRTLHDLAANRLPPLWLERGGHNDIAAFPEYYQYLAQTLETVRITVSSRSDRGGGPAPEVQTLERAAMTLDQSIEARRVPQLPASAAGANKAGGWTPATAAVHGGVVAPMRN